MNNFFKNVTTNNKDILIKKSIITNLSNSVKEIQFCGIDDSGLTKSDNITEASNTLCTVIEAIFLHGLKDSLTRRFKKAISDIDERPEPSFWAPLLVISHRQIIDQITHLTQITTEIGQCRSWIRLALNDCLLSSYLMTIRRDPATLKSFYKTSAFIKDYELLEVAQRLIEGVEAFKSFTLPCNSSLLNQWQLPSLFLAGIWAPTMKACPVAPCDDVVQTIDDAKLHENASDTSSLSSAISIVSHNSGLRQVVALNEDEALKIILAKENRQFNDDVRSSSDLSECEPKSRDSDINYNLGNSLNKRTGWSFDETQQNEVEKEEVEKNEPKSTETSFNALIESYNMLSGSYIKTPDLKEVWQKFDEQPTIIKREDSGSLLKTESVSLAAQIGRIAKERGLDLQNYECASCKIQFALTQDIKVCSFTGEYFCDSCMASELIPIPARIVHNWDFKPYPVSKRAFDYLNEIKDHPTIDFKVLNPFIYDVIEEMANLQILRNQLNFLRAYLYTCREPVIEQLQKQMYPREYMYEHIHQYSLLDLTEIPTGVLAQHLQNVVTFGKEHVYGCWLCKQKGFVCEICDKPKALFPFDVENIYRCETCKAVYHKYCFNASKPCPKCKRKKEREDLPLLQATTE